MSASSRSQAADTGLRRILKNTGWLIGGNSFAAVCSLAYLAILARSLGVKDFGHFWLIFGAGLMVVELAKFETWQMVIRFGTPLVAKRDWDAFGRLAMGGGVMDVAGAAIGCALAWLVIIYLGPTFELNSEYITTAFMFVCVFVLARVSAPIGVLRALDRFDIAVKVGAMTPISRLAAAIIIWWSGASVEKFLLAWALIELLTGIMYWILVGRIASQAMKWKNLRHVGRVPQEHPGLFRFLGITYASTTVWGIIQQGPLLAVGYILGTSAAGIYRIADQIAKALSKLATLSAQALYPEVNRQHHESPRDQFGKLLKRVNITVIIAATVVVALAFSVGGPVLELIGGEPFRRGGPVLVPLVLATSLELASVAYEPVLHAMGKAHYQLYQRILTLIAMVTLFAWLASGGPVWVGWAVALAKLLGYAINSFLVWKTIRRDAAGHKAREA